MTRFQKQIQDLVDELIASGNKQEIFDTTLQLVQTFSSGEKQLFLFELNTSINSAEMINLFSQKHQKKFQQNIEFEIITSDSTHTPNITARLKTYYGTFEGVGKNQKFAKAFAITKADQEWHKLFENNG